MKNPSPSLISKVDETTRISQYNSNTQQPSPLKDGKHRPICGTIHPDDYKDISLGVSLAKEGVEHFKARGGRIEIPCDARWWEYGTAIQLAMEEEGWERDRTLDILDVGSGWGAVGPVLSLRSKYAKVIEYEPDQALYGVDRLGINDVLKSAGRQTINIHPFDIFHMPAQDYDIVFCISVMEHLPPDRELQAWRELAERVRPGGILFITTDCLPKPGHYMFDELRAWNPIPTDFEPRILMMQELGMKVMGTPDYTYHGNYVHDQYSFFRVGFIKE